MKITPQNVLEHTVKLIIAAAIIAACWYFRTIVGYVLLSFILTIIFRPFTSIIRKIHFGRHFMPDWGAAAISLFAIWVIFAILCMVMIPLTIHRLEGLSDINWQESLQSIYEPIEEIVAPVSDTFTEGEHEVELTALPDSALGNMFDSQTLTGAFRGVVNFGLSSVIFFFSVSFIVFFFLKDPTLFTRILITASPERTTENIMAAMEKTETLLQRYFIGLVVESAFIATLIGCALYFIAGMKISDASFIGMAMGIMNIIPYAGPFIGGILAVIIGILTPIDGMTTQETIFTTIGIILTIKGIDDFILQPTIYSGRVKAHPLEIFIVILIAGTVGGILGMLIAIPAYTAIRVFAKEFFPNSRIVKGITASI